MKKVSSHATEVKSNEKDIFTSTPLHEEDLSALDTRIELIQALIPLGL